MNKKIVRISGIVLLVLVVVYVGIGYVVYDKLSRVASSEESLRNTPATFTNSVPEWESFDVTPYYMAEYEAVSFPSRQQGLTLAAWFIPGEADAPAVILTHGLNGCKCETRLLVIAGMLHQHGFNVLAYDMREHGESDIEDGRAAIGNEEYLDLLGAWDWLRQEKGYDPAQIGVYGYSLGAGTTLIAFGQETQLTAAFVDSPYSDLPQIIREELARNDYPTVLTPATILAARLTTGDNLVQFSPQDAINNAAGRPIFIVHGTGDQRINVHHTRQLADLAEQTGADVTVWIPEGVGHVMAEFALPEEYEQALVTFFKAALGYQ